MRKFDLVILIGLIAGTASFSFYRSNRQPAQLSAPAPGPVNFPIPHLESGLKPLLNAKLSRSNVAVNGVHLGMTRAEVVQLLGNPEQVMKLPNQPDIELCNWRNGLNWFYVSFFQGATRTADGALLTINREDGTTEIIGGERELGPPQHIHRTITEQIYCWEGFGVAIESEKPAIGRAAKFRLFDPQTLSHRVDKDIFITTE